MVETVSDFELIRSFLQGDQAAFNKLAARYQSKIYWHARRMTGDHLDADDVMQEVLLTMYNKLHTFQFNSSLYTWVYRITATRSINHLTRKKVRKFFSLDSDQARDLSTSEDIPEQIDIRDKMLKLDGLMQKLPERQREVFILRNFEMLSYEEISAITKKSVGSLKASYFHAVAKIADWMKEDNG